MKLFKGLPQHRTADTLYFSTSTLVIHSTCYFKNPLVEHQCCRYLGCDLRNVAVFIFFFFLIHSVVSAVKTQDRSAVHGSFLNISKCLIQCLFKPVIFLLLIPEVIWVRACQGLLFKGIMSFTELNRLLSSLIIINKLTKHRFSVLSFSVYLHNI